MDEPKYAMNYVSIEAPKFRFKVNVEHMRFVVRDGNETIVEGSAVVQTNELDDRENVIVMSREMAETLIADFLEANGVTVDAVREAIDHLSNLDVDEEDIVGLKIRYKSVVTNNIRYRAREFANNIFNSSGSEREDHEMHWEAYKRAGLTPERLEVAHTAFDERMRELKLSEATNQADSDGNYCEPGEQTGSLYG
jgi:exonuclease I